MYIKRLELTDFRNYEREELSFSPGINIITGDNGEGKTNLLEAIYLLSMGRSFRTSSDQKMIRFERDAFYVRGEFDAGGDELCVEAKLAGMLKSFIIDGIETKKSADLQGRVFTVTFTPDDLRIVSDDPDKRRRFIDRELFQIRPLYYLEVVRYRKLIKNRNALLKEQTPDTELLSVYDEYLSETFARIMINRAEFVRRLSEVSAKLYSSISGGKGDFRVLYAPNIAVEGDESYEDEGKIKEAVRRALSAAREKDLDTGSTSVGAHKDDLKLYDGERNLRDFGSRGQQRTAALALKLAEIEIIKKDTAENPILLLDDVLSELDGHRQKLLIDSFEGSQIIVTAADISEHAAQVMPKGRTIVIKAGKIS